MRMEYLSSTDFYPVLKKMIPDLPDKVIALTLCLAVGEPVIVEVSMVAGFDKESFESIINRERYSLIPDTRSLHQLVMDCNKGLAETRRMFQNFPKV